MEEVIQIAFLKKTHFFHRASLSFSLAIYAAHMKQTDG